MIDVLSEELLTLGEAAQLRPPGRNGRSTHVSTVYRWIATGLRGTKLESIRLGGTLYTSREAIQRFAERLTIRQDDDAQLPAVTSTSSRRRAAEQAERVLERIGF